MQNINKPIYYTIISIVILCSFFLYSANYYPLLSSDDALNILMAHYYQLPNDIYCWGQDRGGTLIPFLSQFFIKFFHFSALTSVSLSNYLVLIIGFIGFASFFQSYQVKVLFAVIWFLPFQRFIEILRYPIGVQYSIIAFSIFLINKLKLKNQKLFLYNHFFLFLIVSFLISSVWVSDLSIVTIGILLSTIFIYDYFENKKMVINKTIIFYVLFGLIACFIFINYAKGLAKIKTENYLSINDLDSVKRAIIILKDSFIEVLTFNTKEILVSIYFWFFILFILFVIGYIVLKRIFINLLTNKWFFFFLIDFAVIITTLLLSHWVLVNDMGRWYFVASYISLSMVILLTFEYIILNNYQSKCFRIFLLFMIILGAMSPAFTMKYSKPKSLRPMIQVVSEFISLGKIGIISDFWNSYIISCPDPELIKATPNDQYMIRNQKLIDEVFEQPNIYLIRDMWMKSFPDTLEQFGYILLRNGYEFRMGGCQVCKYEKIKYNKIFNLGKLNYFKSQILVDNELNKKVLLISPKCDSCIERIVVYGPYISIGIGSFKIKYKLKVIPENDNIIALLEVKGDLGQTELASRKISRADFTSIGKYQNIDLDFQSDKRYTNVEFRIYFYGNADLFLDQIQILEE